MNQKIICQNKKARHNYQISDIFETGIVLRGNEVKSLREGKGNLIDSYAIIKEGEMFLLNSYIGPYSHTTNQLDYDPRRKRKLLLHKAEIRRLQGKIDEKGFSFIPLKMYFKSGKAKVEMALAKGKRLYDKRESLKRKTLNREMEREGAIRFRRG